VVVVRAVFDAVEESVQSVAARAELGQGVGLLEGLLDRVGAWPLDREAAVAIHHVLHEVAAGEAVRSERSVARSFMSWPFCTASQRAAACCAVLVRSSATVLARLQKLYGKC
jgi:hypothetical protein